MDSAVLLDLLGNENRRRILRLLAHKPCYVTEISEYLGVSPKAVIDHLRRLEDAGLVESRTDDQRRKYFHIAQNLRLEVSVSPYRFGAKSAYPASQSLDVRGRCQYISVGLPEDARPSEELDSVEREHGEDGESGGDGSGDERSDADESEADGPEANPEGAVEADGRGDGVEAGSRGEGAETGSRGDEGEIGSRGGGVGADGRGDEDDADGVAALAREYAYLEDVESELSLAQRWIHGRVTDVLDRLTEEIGAEADNRFHAEVLAAIAREARSAREVARELNANPERVESALERLAERGLVRHDGSGWRIE